MTDALIELSLFSAKTIIIALIILIILVAFFALLAKGKEKLKGRLTIKNLNKKYKETTDELLAEILPKKSLKLFFKNRKKAEKIKTKTGGQAKHIFVLNFIGDLKASAVSSLREEITSILM